MDTLRENDEIVRVLYEAINEGEHGLNVVPGLVKRVIRENRWQERYVEAAQRSAAFREFRAFVESAPPDGLGTSLDSVKRICSGDREAVDLIDQATQLPRGGAHPEPSNDDIVIIGRDRTSPVGNTSQAALRRLRKDRPDLHADVIAGGKSPHRAMVEAGFRPKTWTAPADPVTLGERIASRYSRQQIDELVSALLTAVREREVG